MPRVWGWGVNRVVYKYALPIEDHPVIRMPVGAIVLSVGVQFGAPFVWAMVDPTQPGEERRFRFAGTGHPLGDFGGGARFVGTFQMDGGALVFHLFEVA